MNGAEAAQKLGVDYKELSDIVNGRAGISPEIWIKPTRCGHHRQKSGRNEPRITRSTAVKCRWQNRIDRCTYQYGEQTIAVLVGMEQGVVRCADSPADVRLSCPAFAVRMNQIPGCCNKIKRFQ